MKSPRDTIKAAALEKLMSIMLEVINDCRLISEWGD